MNIELRGCRALPRAASDKPVVDVAKRHTARLGLIVADYTGHSLRAGFQTSEA